MPIRITQLTIYPVKGCRGQQLENATMTPEGLDGDRQFAVTIDGRRSNQKQIAGLKFLEATRGQGQLVLGYPGAGSFELALDEGTLQAEEEFRGQQIPLLDMGDSVAEFLSDALGQSVRLQRVRQAVDWFLPHPEFTAVHGQVQTRFVDAAPILLVGQSSLDDLNSRLESPVPMDRFRPNIVVDGLDPYQEDELEVFAFGDVQLDRVTVCERCIVTTMDQQTGDMGKEPLNTLSKYRKRSNDYAGGIMFGIYTTGASGDLKLGDELS